MKKLLFSLFIILNFTASFGQTILNSHTLNLRGSQNNHQILNAVNLHEQTFAFLSDKEKLTVLKYNRALFFSDSISISRPDKEYEFMTGYSFESNGNARVYWASRNLTKLQSILFDFENKTTSVNDFQLAFTDESIITTFSENTFFYILTLPKNQEKLKIYIFRKGEKYERTVDFSDYKFTDEKSKPITFNRLISQNGLEMIDNKVINPLFHSVGKSKMYVDVNKLILTFDSPERTQTFQVDLNTFLATEKIIPQQVLVKAGKSNSYFSKNKIYQFKVNDQELSIASVDLQSGEVVKKHYADIKDTISFRNSPLYSQTGNQRAKVMKNTKKFLQRLSNSDVGLSVYKTPNALMLTVGGVRSVSSTGGIMLGVAMSAAGGGDFSSLFDDESLQSTYFEALFDERFEHQSVSQLPLATDFISQFIAENDIDLQTVFPYKGYYILSYYDSKKKEFVMRKFEDVAE